MKQFILSFVILSLVAPALADLKGLNMKTDELELAAEVEDIERFGEDAAAEEAKAEGTRITRETRSLESEIAKMKRQNNKAQEKTKRLAGLYDQKARLAARVKKQADKTEVRKNNNEKEVARLEAKVKAIEEKSIRAIEQRKGADKRIAQLKIAKKALEKRLVVANRVIKSNNSKRNAARSKSMQLSHRNAKLKKQVATAERKASQAL
jgi:chromosome segregation ATPase